MINAMIQHYKPLLFSIQTMLGYKTKHLLGASIFTSITITGIMEFLQTDFLGVPIMLTSIVSLFIIIDWLLGTSASMKLSNEAKKENNLVEFDKRKFKSTKIGYTIFKFISLFLWLLLSFSIYNNIKGISILSTFIDAITIIPVLLFGFREFISIGESIKTLYGKTPYLFQLGEKIFEILQFKFLNKLKK